MRVNIYAEEMTDRVELIEKRTAEGVFTGVRFFLELPVTLGGAQARGPFMHRPGDDDSAAVTFWGKRELRASLQKALELLDHHEKMAEYRRINRANPPQASARPDALDECAQPIHAGAMHNMARD